MDLLSTIVSLCKRRGFIFQSSEIYGGLKSAYDYGPLGAELKRNIASEWWRSMVYTREDIVGIDASIMMHPNVWKASGHLSGFSDPLVDCRNCKERFRADKAPKKNPGEKVTYKKLSGETISSVVGSCGYVCPVCGSTDLSDERQFNLMFKTSMGPVDPLDEALAAIEGKNLSRAELRAILEEVTQKSAVYLRPETAQAMFVQFLNVQSSMSMKVPFGIAQIGKSFRNEVTTEKFIFRTVEFEQMEMEFFCEPGTQVEWHKYWVEERLKWWRGLSNHPEKFKAREYDKSELAHYADACVDIEFEYPWGFDELEGVASRTNYDLTRHQESSGVKLQYFDQGKNDPETGKPGYKYIPYVIEPAAGLTRAVLAFLCDAYTETEGTTADGEDKKRVFLKLHPKLAPVKCAVLPLVKKDGLPEIGRELVKKFLKKGINVKYDEQQSIGKRYSKHDEIGTPFCLTIDYDTKETGTVTIRDRDTTAQSRISMDEAIEKVQTSLI
jgi:glycyl-tRNA synthetase